MNETLLNRTGNGSLCYNVAKLKCILILCEKENFISDKPGCLVEISKQNIGEGIYGFLLAAYGKM